MQKGKRGYTLLDVVLTLSLMTLGGGAALVQLKSSLTVVDAELAGQYVAEQLKYARQIAVDQLRPTLVEFISPSTIRVTRQDIGGVSTVVSSVQLPPGFHYGLPTGGVGDTPDAYGNAAAVYFNGATSGTFQVDGAFLDANGIVESGTVFTIGSSGGNTSARAVTLSGASGRTKEYSLNGTAWITRN